MRKYYIYKKNKYESKINDLIDSNNELINFIGGGNNLYDYTNLSSTLKFVSKCLNAVTPGPNPTLTVLYGPPGSGKTFAKKQFIDNENKNYVYISEDHIAYNTVQYDKILHTDISNFEDAYKHGQMSYPEIIDSNKIKKLMADYLEIKQFVGNIVDAFSIFSLMYRLNVVLEMTGIGLDSYIHGFIRRFKQRDYFVKLIYPFTTDKQLLTKRIIQRGFIEKRFLPLDYLETALVKPIENFKKIIFGDYNKYFDEIVVIDAAKPENVLYTKKNETIEMTDTFKNAIDQF